MKVEGIPSEGKYWIKLKGSQGWKNTKDNEIEQWKAILTKNNMDSRMKLKEWLSQVTAE